MIVTKNLDEALKKARVLKEKGRDVFSTTRNFDFKCNGGIYLADKKNKIDHLRLDHHAMTQVCRMMHIPAAWVKTKQDMDDPTHLADCLNRHVKKLPSMGVLIRLWDLEGKKPKIRAVFPDNIALLDIYDALKALKVKLGSRVKDWTSIVISDHNLRATGLLDSPKMREKRTGYRGNLGEMYGGIDTSASETGSFPLVGNVYVWRKVCDNGMVIPDSDLSYSLKRSEKEEGGLNLRYREMLDDLRSKVSPAFSRTLKQLNILNSRKVGDNKQAAVNACGKILGIPTSLREGILTAWQPKDNNLFGLWNGISRYGNLLNIKGNFSGSRKLHIAAGNLAKASPHILSAIQEESEKGNSNE